MTQSWIHSAIRAFTTLAFALAVASLFPAKMLPSGNRSYRRDTVIAFVTGLVVTITLPAVYVAARCRHDVMMLEELLDQSRFGEAQTQIREMIQLSPSMAWRGQPLAKVSHQLERQIHDLEKAVARPMTDLDTDEKRLQRCRQLAMLGCTREALIALEPLFDSSVSPAAFDLAGTIYETTAQWEAARSYHRRAKEEWSSRLSPEREAGILRAAVRLGFCERKLGHYDQAEAEYRAVLARSPTADSHFLLAQFYEDMQQSTKARLYARHAMELAPQRYQHEGTKLINKLMVGHFGCAGVFTAESAEWDRKTRRD